LSFEYLYTFIAKKWQFLQKKMAKLQH